MSEQSRIGFRLLFLFNIPKDAADNEKEQEKYTSSIEMERAARIPLFSLKIHSCLKHIIALNVFT